jgi:hypothetical protein
MRGKMKSMGKKGSIMEENHKIRQLSAIEEVPEE